MSNSASLPKIEKIKRSAKPPESNCSKIGHFLCTCVLLLNVALLVLYFSPQHIRAPVQRKIASVVAPPSHALRQHHKQVQAADAQRRQEQTEDDDHESSMQHELPCDKEALLQLVASVNVSSSVMSSCSDRLAQLTPSFFATIHVCANFAELRRELSLVTASACGPFSSSLLTLSANINSTSIASLSSVAGASKRAMRRFITRHALLFSLNGSVPIHYEHLTAGAVAVVNNSANINISTNVTTPNSSNISSSDDGPDRIVPNATLRELHRHSSKLVDKARKMNLHLTPHTKIGEEPALPLSVVFVHCISAVLHNVFDATRRVLVVSGLSLPTVEVAIFAFTATKHIDSVNQYAAATNSAATAGGVYRTTVPRIASYSPREFAASNINKKNYYSVIVSFNVIASLGLGREQGMAAELDPFADMRALDEYWTMLRPGGVLFLTLPVGADCTDMNRRRIYGRERLALLLRGWSIDLTVGIDTEILRKRRPCGQVSDALVVLRRIEPHNEKEELARIPGIEDIVVAGTSK